jgi:hypothetical protein
MALDQIEHKITASNILFGLTHFLTLVLPPEWRIRKSFFEPDVHSNVRRGDRVWVDAGQTDHLVYHPLRRIALDLTIIVRRGKRDGFKTKGIHVHSQGPLVINGHAANYHIGEVGVGFLKRKRARTLRVSMHCSDLGRTIMITFTGQCQDEDLREILESLPELSCH